jgi:hypothetical protein
MGGDAADFGTLSVGGARPVTLTFTGTPFYYDPALGNLLMQVEVLGLTEAHGYESHFRADYTGVETQRNYAYGGSPTASGSDDGALVTRFETDGPSTAVPEPGSLLLLGLGIGLSGLALRGRRN